MHSGSQKGSKTMRQAKVGAKMVTTKGESGKKTRKGTKPWKTPERDWKTFEKQGLTVFCYTVIPLLIDCCYSHLMSSFVFK